jgi:hypothetical protein
MQDLEAAMLAVLALNYPKPVDAIDMFSTLWKMKRIPAASMAQGMELLVITFTDLENRGYGCMRDIGSNVFYALTKQGADELICGEIKDTTSALHALMGADRLAGGKPC